MNCELDTDYLRRVLLKLLGIHSPSGYTDPVVREVCTLLKELGIGFDLTRRGAIRATIGGASYSPDRALVAHVDTLGAQVKELKANGRLALVPVGHWSARFAEGARVSVFTDDHIYRGQVLPLKASGHTYNDGIDTQPVGWDQVELRVDEKLESTADLAAAGFNVGDFVGFDSNVEIFPNGYVAARHLDDKAGVAALLTAAKWLVDHEAKLPVDLHLIFTISEEVGSGASSVLYGDVAELVSIDNGTCAPGQNSSEFGVTVAMADSTGPFDYHLTHHLLHLCENNGIPHRRDIFKYYRCDSAAALDAGNDIRTALITFGVDASHGYERTNIHALESVARLCVAYALQRPLYASQKTSLTSLDAFPKTRRVEVDSETRKGAEPIKQTQPDETKESG